jgi:hypothetical protein
MRDEDLRRDGVHRSFTEESSRDWPPSPIAFEQILTAHLYPLFIVVRSEKRTAGALHNDPSHRVAIPIVIHFSSTI